MDRRLRWFQISSRVDITRLGDALGSLPYSDKRGFGFRIEETTRTTIAGRFVERVARDEIVIDPFGNERKFHRVEYPFVDFELRNGAAGLQLTNPPRSVSTLLAQLSAAADDFSATQLRPDVLRWMAGIERAVGRVVVREMSIANTPLSTSTRGDFILTGSGDVRREARRLPAGGVVASVILVWRGPRDRVLTCELSRNGATMADEQADEIESTVSAALRQAPAAVPE